MTKNEFKIGDKVAALLPREQAMVMRLIDIKVLIGFGFEGEKELILI